MKAGGFAEGSTVVRHHLGVSYTLIGVRADQA
jgi:hypothetical protein